MTFMAVYTPQAPVLIAVFIIGALALGSATLLTALYGSRRCSRRAFQVLSWARRSATPIPTAKRRSQR